MAQGRGYGLVSSDGFVGFDLVFDAGTWKAFDTRKLEDKDGVLVQGADTLRVLAMYKLWIRGAIRELVQALGGDDALAPLDATWDRYQLRLGSQITTAATSDDPAVVAAAGRLRAKLLSGNGTDQIGFKFQEEVKFARKQLKLAEEKPLADDVALCEVRATLDLIKTATDALGKATGEGTAEGRAPSRSAQVRAAMTGCVSAFNAVHDGLDWLLDHVTQGDERSRIEALVGPFQGLLTDSAGNAPPAPVPVAQPAPPAGAPPKAGS